jgi:hypothetical protein
MASGHLVVVVGWFDNCMLGLRILSHSDRALNDSLVRSSIPFCPKKN